MGDWDVLSITERLDADARATGRGVTIAFVDVGFYPHPDLMRPTRRVRAYVDASRDEPDSEEFFSPHAWSWHGTMTACCAAGSGYLSGGRYRGLASDADVVLIKAGVEDGRVRGKNVASAIRFPLRRPEFGIRVMNVSLGVDRDDPHASDVERAVREVTAAGIVLVAAAGNTAGVLPEPPGSAAEAITVGGEDDRNTRDGSDDEAWSSSAGTTHPGVDKPDLLAPALRLAAPMLPGTLTAREGAALFHARSVLGEVLEQQTFSSSRASIEQETTELAALLDGLQARIERGRFLSEHYQHVEGTSFAAPITASVVAQMLEVAPALTPADVRKGLLTTARALAKVPRAVQGAGVLQPRAAVDWARRRAPQSP